MNKVWLVFKHEYARHVFQRRFLVSLISMPLMILVLVGVSIFASFSGMDRSPVGVVDETGRFLGVLGKKEPENWFDVQVDFIAYPGEAAADKDLHAGKIQAYYVLQGDRSNPPSAALVYLVEPSASIQNEFENRVRKVLLADQPPQVVRRLEEGSHLTIVSADGTRRMGENGWINLVMVFVVGFLFVIITLTSSGYLMQALVGEKENRTIEMVITSLSPRQLMAGKILGNLCVGLTQLAVWISCVILFVRIGSNSFDWLRDLSFSLADAGMMLLIMLPALVLVAALMAFLGVTVSEAREAQQWSGIITLPLVAPYWLASPIMAHPNGALSVALSLFPLTAPVTLSIRSAVTILPVWQVALSSALLILSAVGSILLAAKAFRLGMLRVGKRLPLAELFRKQAGSHA